jgi:hypothetical protein
MMTYELRCSASLRRQSATLFVLTTLLIAPGLAGAQESPVIADVLLSPDSERLVIKMLGSAPAPEATALRGPARLVLDFKGARPGNGANSLKNPGGFIREVRVARSATGARVEVEFTEDRVPEHRIRQLSSTLMVFFARSSRDGRAGLEARETDGRGRVRQAYGIEDAPSRKWDSAPAAAGGGEGLFIRKADVADGLIVLDVAERKDPNTTYRITLGVDLARQGFRTASVKKRPKSLKSTEEVADRWSAPAGSSGTVKPKGPKPEGRKPTRASQTGK